MEATILKPPGASSSAVRCRDGWHNNDRHAGKAAGLVTAALAAIGDGTFLIGRRQPPVR